MGLEGRWTDRRTEAPRVMGISDLLFNTHFQSELTAFLLEGSCFPACRISSETLRGWLLNSDPRIFSRCRRFFRVCADPGRRAVAAARGGCCCYHSDWPRVGAAGRAASPACSAWPVFSVHPVFTRDHPLCPIRWAVCWVPEGACVFPSCLTQPSF